MELYFRKLYRIIIINFLCHSLKFIFLRGVTRIVKSKYKIAIIGVYFGKLPKYFNLWLQSCKYNETIDFLIFTDNIIENVPKNVFVYKMTLKKMKEMADFALGFATALTTPYKCCDFRPAYGCIFSKYIKNYDFWGHCDFDLIFGDIRNFITDDILSENDKIFNLGHLSLYKNNEECNNYFKLEGSKCGDYKTVFKNEINVAFDEKGGIYQIYKKNSIPVYDKRKFADISMIYKRFRLALNDTNYKYQVFYWENGHTYRKYIDMGSVKKEEFCYIHFKKRPNFTISFDEKNTDAFYITMFGFIPKSRAQTIDIIKKYNPPQPVEELLITIKYEIARITKNILRPLYKFIKIIPNKRRKT